MMSLQRRGAAALIRHADSSEREKREDAEFVTRESPLTLLLRHSQHIQVLYHIFIAGLLVLLCDTIVFDLVESGRINVGLKTIGDGFRGIRSSATLWLFEFLMTLSLYPGLWIYSWVRKFIRKNSGAHASHGARRWYSSYVLHCLSELNYSTWQACGACNTVTTRKLCRLWSIAGVVGAATLVAALLVVTIWQLATEEHALASTVALSCELFRNAMKMCALAAACAPRCQDASKPLPTFSHYVYFLLAPTLLYRDHYPRTKSIRWSLVATNMVEVAAVIFYNSFLFERFILPYWSDYGKQPQVEAGDVVRGMFACILPGFISFLCGFYCLLHAWLNAFAEMLRFGDRLFYEEWWTSSQFSQFYRCWNRVVYSWLRDHIYRPLAPTTGRVGSTLAVFIVSAIAHEIVLALSFGFFYPVVIILFGIMGCLLVPLTTTSGKRYPNFFNVLLWLSYLIGNGVFWSLYPMKYFARKNCPPSENDSYFIPKSWSCPEVVLKANWTFQNPIHIIY